MPVQDMFWGDRYGKLKTRLPPLVGLHITFAMSARKRCNRRRRKQ